MWKKRAISWLLLTVVSFALASLLSSGVVSAAANFSLLNFGPTSFTTGVPTYVWVYVKNIGDQSGTFIPEGYSPTTNGWNWSNNQSSLSPGATQNFTNLLALVTNSNATSGQIMVKIRNNATGEYDDWMNKSATVSGSTPELAPGEGSKRPKV